MLDTMECLIPAENGFKTVYQTPQKPWNAVFQGAGAVHESPRFPLLPPVVSGARASGQRVDLAQAVIADWIRFAIYRTPTATSGEDPACRT